MTDNPRVEELLEEILDSDATPEEVCRECPELLPEVRAGWQRLRTLKAEVGALFPESTSLIGPAPDAVPPVDMTILPCVRGHEVQQVLGHGGMGVVYKAWHLRLNRPVAVKMLLAGPYARREELERFLREAEAVAGLRHPNIVQVYDVGDLDGRPYFTMEFVEGGNLAQKLAGTPLPTEQTATLLATLADAVQVAHQSGIVHRDLKPANILLTADGTPKITDFGLARRLEDRGGLTLTGSPVGTPSYMAPEQAQGKNDTIGPGTDVYALGAILYECLTGRPPFKAESAAETHRQVIYQDPASPRLLNPKVPRDLETICLKCLHKEPERRYASAAALADDLRRFGEGRPIQARPVGWAERSWRWGRRKPTAAALLAMALAFVGLASGGGVWLLEQQAERRVEVAQLDADLRSEIKTAVAQAASLRKGFHFREARELLEQARQRLELAGPDDLRRQVEQAQTDLKLADRLDAARIKSATLAGGVDAPASIESLYVSVFAETGLGREGDDIKAMAASVRESSLSAELIAALDDWASIATGPTRREWLLAVAREADQNQARNHLRRPQLWTDPDLWKHPEKLAQDLKAAEFSPQLALALSRAADEFHADAVPLLAAAQARFPQDFWLTAALGSSLAALDRWDEALGFYRAALALRPDASAAHGCLGCALYKTGRRDEAVRYFEQALHIDPESVLAHGNLAIALHEKGQTNEAMDHFQQALRIDPKSAGVHFNLGTALLAKGQLDDAIDQFQQTLNINPKSAMAHYNLGLALYRKRRLDESIDQFQQAVRIDPKFAKAYNNLGVALWEKGRPEEAIEPFQQAVRLQPNDARGHTNLSRAFQTAARDALRAAAAQGSEKERAAKRRHALAWLRADLEFTTKLIRDGKLPPQSVANLQIYPTLASVRDPAALAKLPDSEREEWQRYWMEVAAALGNDPVTLGRAHAARREWAQAADYYARGLKRGPTDDGQFWFEYAALLLLSGDRPGYEKACAQMVDRCGKAKGLRSYHVARACTLAPDAVADMSLPGRLAEKELKGSREFWSLTEQGALAYRAGRFKDAMPLFEQSVQDNRKPGAAVVNYLWLALARQRLGKIEEARRFLGTSQKCSISMATGCRPARKRNWGWTCTTGWRRTSCAARRKR